MSRPADVVLRNANVVDGLRSPARHGDLVIESGRITEMSPATRRHGRMELDVAGRTIMPGFVDMHSHSDIALIREPSAAPKVLQGVTTEVLGQDGLSYAPSTPKVREHLGQQLRGWNGSIDDLDWPFDTVKSFLEAFAGRVAVNVAYLVPHGTLRLMALESPDAPADPRAMERMRQLLVQGLLGGACGMSAGLMYYPGLFADDHELAELGSVIAEHQGFLSPHHRNYGTKALESYEDMLKIGERSGCAVHLTHANMSFPVNAGRGEHLLRLIDDYEARGVEISLDTYPYDAGSTSLHALLPSWAHVGGNAKLLDRLGDPATRERLARSMEVEGSDAFHHIPIDWSSIVVSNVGAGHLGSTVGHSIAALALDEGRPAIDVVAHLLVQSELDVSIVAHIGNEDNVRTIMQDERHVFSTDGLLRGQRPHPRGWGTFPRVLSRYVRELGLFSLETAAWKMARRPCEILGLRDRGYLAEGAHADLVILDPDEVTDTATFDEPRQHPAGIHHVFVNGQPVVVDAQLTGQTPGLAVTRGA